MSTYTKGIIVGLVIAIVLGAMGYAIYRHIQKRNSFAYKLKQQQENTQRFFKRR